MLEVCSVLNYKLTVDEEDVDTEEFSALRTSYNMKRKTNRTKMRTAAAKRLKHHLSAGKKQGSGMYSLLGTRRLLLSASLSRGISSGISV